MTRRRYQAYRDSGVEWLGEVPAHWGVRKFRTLLRGSMSYGVLKPESYDGEDGIRLIRILDLSGGIRDESLLRISPEQSAEYQRTVVRPGDVVLSVVGTIGECFEVPPRLDGANLSRALARIQLGTEVQSSFLRYYFHSRSFFDWIDSTVRGTAQMVLNLGQLDSLQFPLPPIEEQRAIAAFLDWETSKVDALIEKKRLLIERLEEQRSALISRTVTRGLPPEAARAAGLDPSPRLKPSGVEWLGDVPEHWEVDRLKWSILDAKNGVWGEEPDGENDLICVRVADFDRRGLRVDLSNATLRAISPAQQDGRRLERDDLVLEKSGGGEHQLVGCVVSYECDEEAVTSNFIARLRAAPGMVSRFWAYLHASLYAGRLNYPAIKQTTGIQNLDGDAYLNTRVPFPPEDEQRAIAHYLDEQAAHIDTSVDEVERAIERLQEYRTALITVAVTGKIDVRESAGEELAAG